MQQQAGSLPALQITCEATSMIAPQRIWVGPLLAAWVLAAAACSAALPTARPPAAQDLPTHTPIPPKDTSGQAHVDSIEMLILESFPVQIRALVRGSLSDGCTTIDQITQTRDGNAFQVTISTVRKATAVCTQALVPFEETIPLQVVGLKAGDYTVAINGVVATFRLDVDNIAKPQPEPGQMIVGEATVSSVAVWPVPGDALAVNVVVSGDLPDGCTQIARVTHTLAGQELDIIVVTERPADLMCTQVLVPFEQAIRIEAAALPTGTITVIANGATTTFELP